VNSIGLTGNLKDDPKAIAAHKEYHRKVWPEVEASPPPRRDRADEDFPDRPSVIHVTWELPTTSIPPLILRDTCRNLGRGVGKLDGSLYGGYS